jgi:hypothetical protein
MSLRALAAAAVVLTAAAPLAQAQSAADLAGPWRGGYISSNGADVNEFAVKLAQAGTTLSGTVTETNAFGDVRSALFLTSTVSGSLNGRTVNLVKTYDGSGGVSHSVRYTGQISPNGRRIAGTYDAGAGATGVFEMVR